MNGIDKDYHGKLGGIGIVIYPYQIAFGISLRYWNDPNSIAFRIYILWFKFWGYIIIS